MKQTPSSQRRIVGTVIRVHPDGYAFIEPDDESLPDFFANIASFLDREDFFEDRRVDFIPGVARNPKTAPPALQVRGLPEA